MKNHKHIFPYLVYVLKTQFNPQSTRYLLNNKKVYMQWLERNKYEFLRSLSYFRSASTRPK